MIKLNNVVCNVTTLDVFEVVVYDAWTPACSETGKQMKNNKIVHIEQYIQVYYYFSCFSNRYVQITDVTQSSSEKLRSIFVNNIISSRI